MLKQKGFLHFESENYLCVPLVFLTMIVKASYEASQDETEKKAMVTLIPSAFHQ